jgi:glycosyltransferase involved in cell wall biosynthesis
MTPAATILITTRNRKDELAAALASCLTQSAPCETLVIDDGSTDGTAEMVRERFPSVRLKRHETSGGYILRRNEGAELASAPYVFSIDDDAAFPSPHTVAQTVAEFDHPRVGAVAIPFINVNQDDVVRQRAPDADRVYVTASYIGTAHALRRDVFLRLGGYRPFFVHQGEEGDYCLRMLAAGLVTRLGRADPIHHFESPRRDFTRMDVHGRRNDVLFAWYNVPLPYLLWHLPATVINGLRHGLRCGRPGNQARGLARGFLDAAKTWRDRRPVARAVYRLHRRLRRGDLPLDAVLPELERIAAG